MCVRQKLCLFIDNHSGYFSNCIHIPAFQLNSCNNNDEHTFVTAKTANLQ